MVVTLQTGHNNGPTLGLNREKVGDGQIFSTGQPGRLNSSGEEEEGESKAILNKKELLLIPSHFCFDLPRIILRQVKENRREENSDHVLKLQWG